MAIRVTARDYLIDNKQSGFVLEQQRFYQYSSQKVIQEASFRSGISKGVITSALEAVADVVNYLVTQGYDVPVPSIGTFKAEVICGRAHVSSADQVKYLVDGKRIIFTPNQQLQHAVDETCIDIKVVNKNGDIIKVDCTK